MLASYPRSCIDKYFKEIICTGTSLTILKALLSMFYNNTTIYIQQNCSIHVQQYPVSIDYVTIYFLGQ